MADSTSAMNIPAGYTLEQPSTPTPSQAPGGGGLPPGYTLETDSTPASSTPGQLTPYDSAKFGRYTTAENYPQWASKPPAAGPNLKTGEMEAWTGAHLTPKQSVTSAAKFAAPALLAPVAGPALEAAEAVAPHVAELGESVVDKAKAVASWAKDHPIKAYALEQIGNELGVHPFDLMHKAVKYGASLFSDDTDK